MFEGDVNRARFSGPGKGFYESFFLRANHPARPLAFWIRCTLASPRQDPDKTVGELWGIFFDGERGQHCALKAEIPWADCTFDRTKFNVRIGDATLGPGRAHGGIEMAGRRMMWDLQFGGDQKPLYLLPQTSYESRFPAAKSLVSLPMAQFKGAMSIDGERVAADGWTGSQNHNWGTRHTDRYAWGQVAGFDSHPDSFLEVATGQLKFGPFWSPPMTLLVLRHGGREYALNTTMQALGARARMRYFDWEFRTAGQGVAIVGRISAQRQDFVGLAYRNPIGGTKVCLNSKIASCRLTMTDRLAGISETLETKNRAAFEMLSDDATGHGVAVSA